jgi:hypothetical protein
MIEQRRIVRGVAVLACLLGSGLAAWLWQSRADVPAPRVEPPRISTSQYQGVASCASAGCHGGNGPLQTPGSEYTTWMMHDPHANAYAVLLEARSRDIARNMHRGKPAHEDSLCLNCHVYPGFERSERGVRFSVTDGVGCESCHGSAEKWLREHHQDSWRMLTPPEKLKRGMLDTKAMTGRARLCVVCHVGVPGSDVNHDLLAAGHPRLAFEFSAYHAVLPRHWDDVKDRHAHPDWEVRAWRVGQEISARAALELLAHRAKEAEADPARQPWPEFAEYDCAACHRDLQSVNRTSARNVDRQPPGRLPMSGWYTARLSESLPGPTDLQAEMRKPWPNPKTVAALARQALDQVRLEPSDVATADGLERRFTSMMNEPTASMWEEAAQRYHAMAAHYHAWRDVAKRQPPAAWNAHLHSLAAALEFPAKFTTTPRKPSGK